MTNPKYIPFEDAREHADDLSVEELIGLHASWLDAAPREAIQLIASTYNTNIVADPPRAYAPPTWVCLSDGEEAPHIVMTAFTSNARIIGNVSYNGDYLRVVITEGNNPPHWHYLREDKELCRLSFMLEGDFHGSGEQTFVEKEYQKDDFFIPRPDLLDLLDQWQRMAQAEMAKRSSISDAAERERLLNQLQLRAS